MGHPQTNIALKPILTVINGGKAKLTNQFNIPSREVVILSLILIFTQLLDGILTGIGVNQFGLEAEGNMLVRSLMESWGYITALIVTKGIAILIITGLCFLACQVTWITKAMKSLIAIYLLIAIIPWSLLLVKNFF